MTENGGANVEFLLDKMFEEKIEDLSKELDSLKEISHEENINIEMLKEQLKFANKEKQSLHVLWQNSLETIDHLESELKFYTATSQPELDKRRPRLRALPNESEEIKSKYEATLQEKTAEIGRKKDELAKAVESQTNTFQIIRNLEDEILKLQERLLDSQQKRDDLEREIVFMNDKIEVIRRENSECRAKVSEAVDVVQAALNEKDAALLREKSAKDEAEKLTKTLSDIVDESTQKVENELEKVKHEYNDKIRELLAELRSTENGNKIKELEIEKLNRKVSDQQSDIEKLQHLNYPSEESITKLMTLEKTLESTFQKLLLSEKRNVQLESEKEALKSDLEQMANHYERDIKSREIEKTTLQTKIRNLQTENHNKLTEMSGTIQKLHSQLESVETDYKQRIALKESSQEETNHLVAELHQQIESQINMNRKWKTETKSIVEGLRKHVRESEGEATDARRENQKLKKKLIESHESIREYRKIVRTVSDDLIHMSSTTGAYKDKIKEILKKRDDDL